MSLAFLWIRFFALPGNETTFDKIIFLILVDLDIIALFTALRWWKFNSLSK